MSELTDDLHREHVRILAVLESVAAAGVGSEAGREALFDARQLLLEHLDRENHHLYPALRWAAKTDEALERLLDSFASDMEEVAEVAVAFFDAHTREDGGLVFEADCQGLITRLRHRIEREEMVLYPEYDKRYGSASP